MRDIYWICFTLDYLGVSQSDPTVLHHNDLGSFNWTHELQSRRKFKQSCILYHDVRGSVDSNAVQVQYVATTDNEVDLMAQLFVTGVFNEFFKGFMCLKGVSPLHIEKSC